MTKTNKVAKKSKKTEVIKKAKSVAVKTVPLLEIIKGSYSVTKKGWIGFLSIIGLYLMENFIFIALSVYAVLSVDYFRDFFKVISTDVSTEEGFEAVKNIDVLSTNQVILISVLIIGFVLVLSVFGMQYYISKIIYIKQLVNKDKNISPLRILFLSLFTSCLI
jgi:hypothetical protein